MIVVTATACELASEKVIEDAVPRRLPINSDHDRSAELARRTVQRLCSSSGIPTGARLGSTVSLSKLGIDGLVRTLERGEGLADRWREYLAPSILPAFPILDQAGPGPAITAIGACATGLHSWIRGAMFLENDEADVVVAGAAEATLSAFVLGGFRRMGVLSSTRPRPFDRRRDGFVPAEGAAMAMLERESDARARGARLLGGIEGWAMMGSNVHVMSGSCSSDAIAALADSALASARREKNEIVYVHLHGTGTRSNDSAEAEFLREYFERDGLVIPASSTKARTGHCLGAAGAIEAVATLEALAAGVAPPNYGLEECDEHARSECLITSPTSIGSGVGLVLSYGFGGTLSALVLSAPQASRVPGT